MNALKCIACKGIHNTIPEMKACHKANNAFIGEGKTKKENTAPKPFVAKTVKTFEDKQEAEEFVAANTNARLLDTVKVKRTSIWNEDSESYVQVVIKTYTVVID